MTETFEKVEDIEIRLLLEALYHRYHYDFRSYAMSSIRRRLRQAREQLGFATISAMQERVLHHPEMLDDMLRFLTVQVSEMFRDPSYCPSSNDLRLFGLWKSGVSGSVCGLI